MARLYKPNDIAYALVQRTQSWPNMAKTNLLAILIIFLYQLQVIERDEDGKTYEVLMKAFAKKYNEKP
jgi:hypothetical protein